MKTQKAKHTKAYESKEKPKAEEHHFLSNHELNELIKQQAYELYEARGCQPGCELNDWLEAEKFIEARKHKKTH